MRLNPPEREPTYQCGAPTLCDQPCWPCPENCGECVHLREYTDEDAWLDKGDQQYHDRVDNDILSA